MEVTFLDMKLEKGYRIIIDDEIIVIRSPGHEEDDDDSVAELTEHDLQTIHDAVKRRADWRNRKELDRIRAERRDVPGAEAGQPAKAVTFPSLPKKTN